MKDVGGLDELQLLGLPKLCGRQAMQLRLLTDWGALGRPQTPSSTRPDDPLCRSVEQHARSVCAFFDFCIPILASHNLHLLKLLVTSIAPMRSLELPEVQLLVDSEILKATNQIRPRRGRLALTDNSHEAAGTRNRKLY